MTKLFIPRFRPPIVSRPGLLKRLNEGLLGRQEAGAGWLFDRKLTLVSAPAGFGKTTLLTEWIHGAKHTSPSPISFAWLSLDERDNELSRFLTYMVAALQVVEQDIGRATNQALSQPDLLGMEPAVTTLINDIVRISGQEVLSGLSHSKLIALVLDDYHLIQTGAVHDAVAYLLEHLPPQLHLVVATRAEPPLQMARLRGRGQIAEINASDLRFSFKQAKTFLNDVMGLDLSEETVEELVDYTEGWIAALKMIAVSLQHKPADSKFRLWERSHRLVDDFLMEEVLKAQPDDIQQFLLETSILDRLSGPLCEAVTGRDDSQAVLEWLERVNLFTVPLDTERKWYRYHPLFASLLQARLDRATSMDGRILHHRASSWYSENGVPELAIKHAFSASDNESAADLIEKVLERIFMRGEFMSVLSWLDSLPQASLATRPRLKIYHALVMILAGRPAEEIEAKITQAAEGDGERSTDGEVTLLRSLIAVMRGDTQLGYRLCMEALERSAGFDRFFQSLIYRNLGALYKQTGDVRAAKKAIAEGARIAQISGDQLSTIVTQHQQAEVMMLSGQLHEAYLQCQSLLKLAVDKMGRPLIVRAKILVTMGELRREWNDLNRAEEHLTEAIGLAGKQVELWGLSGHLVLARVRAAQGDLTAARESLQIASNMAIKFDTSMIDDRFVAAYQARIWLIEDNVAAVHRWAEEGGLLEPSGEGISSTITQQYPTPYALREFELVTLARFHLASNRSALAKQVLEPLLDKAERLGRINSIIEIEALRAMTFKGMNKVDEAQKALRRSLTLAQPGGYIRLFVEMGPIMAELVQEMNRLGNLSEYTSKLLSAISTGRELVKNGSRTSQSLVEPLSSRELQVLQLLTTHMTSTEIANELHISANTVRFHTKNIYSKLGVHSRNEAVEQARILALL